MTDETAVLETVETDIDLKRKELEKINCEIEEHKQKLKRLQRREISPKEQEISDKQVATQVKGKATEALIEKQKAFDNVIVTGKFYNLRNPGQTVKLTYMKYADDPVKWYEFEHGKVYSIVRGFSDQINDYYHTPIFIKNEAPMDPNKPRSQISSVDTSNKRYSFVPLNF